MFPFSAAAVFGETRDWAFGNMPSSVTREQITLGVISGTFTQHEPCSWIETSSLEWIHTMKKKISMHSCKK